MTERSDLTEREKREWVMVSIWLSAQSLDLTCILLRISCKAVNVLWYFLWVMDIVKTLT